MFAQNCGMTLEDAGLVQLGAGEQSQWGCVCVTQVSRPANIALQWSSSSIVLRPDSGLMVLPMFCRFLRNLIIRLLVDKKVANMHRKSYIS